jgi:hypothetical protein
LDKWHARCVELLAEIGVPDAQLHRWENIVPPWPDEVPAGSPEVSSSGEQPGPSPLPAASPAP